MVGVESPDGWAAGVEGGEAEGVYPFGGVGVADAVGRVFSQDAGEEDFCVPVGGAILVLPPAHAQEDDLLEAADIAEAEAPFAGAVHIGAEEAGAPEDDVVGACEAMPAAMDIFEGGDVADEIVREGAAA